MPDFNPPPPPPEPRAFNPRDDILDRASRGEITPEQAEEEALRLGVGPLARRPDSDAFDTMKEPWWTLPMAAAWVIWRTPAAVRRVWQAYRSEVREWCGPVYYRIFAAPDDEAGFRGPTGHLGYRIQISESESKSSPTTPGTRVIKEYRLSRLEELTLFDVLGRAAYKLEIYGPIVLEGAAAQSELWRRLQGEELVAEGVPRAGPPRVRIPASEWNDLDHFDFDGWSHDSIGSHLEKTERYRGVRVRQAEVVELWPEPLPKSTRLPPTMRPVGGGYMPLYCAAQWIATRGDTDDFDPMDRSRWEDAYGELLARLASDDAGVIGSRDGVREPVPGFNFAACPVDYPFQENDLDLHFGDVLYLRSYPYLGKEKWGRGADDSLRFRGKGRWIRLMVAKDDVARLWPFSTSPRIGLDEVMRTGAAGRPSSMHLLRGRFARRVDEGQIAKSLAGEVRVLREWFQREYPNEPTPAKKTAENGLRQVYNAAKAPRN